MNAKPHRRLAAALLILGTPLLAGCPQLGAWMYTLGMVPKEKVTAEYKLPSGSLMILVDDAQDLVQPPTARRQLVDILALKMREQKIADRVTTNEEIARIQQSEAKFDQRGVREIGRLAKADTVLWLNIKQFSVPSDLEIAVTPATLSLIIKVINAKAEKREEVRLWPQDREGHLMTVSITPNQIHDAKTQTAVHEKLMTEAADAIVKLFHDYEIEH